MGLFSRRQPSALPVGVVSALAGYGASVIDTRAGKPS